MNEEEEEKEKEMKKKKREAMWIIMKLFINVVVGNPGWLVKITLHEMHNSYSHK